MSISAIRGCSATSSLKRTSSAASASRSIGLRPRTPLSASEIVVSLDQAPGERRVERRQGQRAVLEDLDQLAAHAEQQDRAELRVEAAADDQLVAGPVDHRLDRDALEVLGAGLLGDRRLGSSSKASRTASGVAQVED